MPLAQIPLVDDENPCYCPSVSASAYTNMLRQALHSHSIQIHGLSLHSFLQKLGAAIFKDGPQRVNQMAIQMTEPRLSESLFLSTRCRTSRRNQVRSDLAGRPSGLASESHRRATLKRSFPSVEPHPGRDSATMHLAVKRPRYSSSELDLTSTSDDFGNWKHLSFDRVMEHTPCSANRVAPDRGQVQAAHPIGSEELSLDTQTILLGLDRILPGLGFRQALATTNILESGRTEEFKHQAIADYVADKGLLNERVLDLLGRAKLSRLNLGPTLCDEMGLNLQGSGILHVLSRPKYFEGLTELSFTNGRFQRDFDLVHIQGLRRLKELCLEATGIGNEAVFLLVSLKGSLEKLDLSFNPDIDDDAIPAIALFTRLKFLSIYDTSINMPGLRKLTQVIVKEGRIPAVEIPGVCEKYIDSIQGQYLWEPRSPLITDPSLCSVLSEPALKRNLAAHSMVNPRIVASGTREEMVERLARILETRKLDHLVYSLFTGEDCTDGSIVKA